MTTQQVAKNGVIATDIDGDGWPDLSAANDYDANALYLNRRDGKFREVASVRCTRSPPVSSWSSWRCGAVPDPGAREKKREEEGEEEERVEAFPTF